MKDNMEKVKRPILFTGLIMDIVSLSLLLVGFLLILDVQEVMINDTYKTVLFVLIGVTVLGILFSVLGLMACGQIYYLYKSKKVFIVTVFVILCIFIVFALFGLLNMGIDTGLEVIALLVMATGATLTMIGHVDADQNNDTEYIKKHLDTIKKAANDKIDKLAKLKELNVISEDEFEALKQKQINNV
jgi:hypothetical protein